MCSRSSEDKSPMLSLEISKPHLTCIRSCSAYYSQTWRSDPSHTWTGVFVMCNRCCELLTLSLINLHKATVQRQVLFMNLIGQFSARARLFPCCELENVIVGIDPFFSSYASSICEKVICEALSSSYTTQQQPRVLAMLL